MLHAGTIGNVLGYDIRALTIANVLRSKAESLGDRHFLRYIPDGRAYSYADIDLESNRIAHGLLEAGVTSGAHVAVMMRNTPELLLLYFALGKIGAVAVQIHVAARGAQLRHLLTSAHCEWLAVEAGLLAEVRGVVEDIAELRTWIVLGDESRSKRSSKRLLPFETLLSENNAQPNLPVRFSDPAFICYTSGTTGPSKGVVFSQARALLGAIGLAAAHGYCDTDVIYVCLPMFHMSGMQAGIYLALVTNASVELTAGFSASTFWQSVRSAQATTTGLLGSMTAVLWSRPPSPNDSAHSLRLCLTQPIPTYAREFERRFRMRFVSSYGLTDFGSPTAYTLVDPPSKLGSTGRLRSGWDLRIVDEDDFDVPCGSVGEIALRCNIVEGASAGYYGMPAETLMAFRNGWFHTGDRGRLDADGYLWFVDRLKDSVRRRGENISAFEVEQCLLGHPAVAEAAVFGVRADTAEEEIAAVVVLRTEQRSSEADIARYCEGRIARFMVPRFIRIANELPRTASQKIEKFRLRQFAERSIDSYWDRERNR